MPTALLASDGTPTRMPKAFMALVGTCTHMSTAAVSSLRLLQSNVQCSTGIRRHLQSHAHCPMASTSTYSHMPITFLCLYRQLHSHAQRPTLLTTGICMDRSIDALHTADTCTHLHAALCWHLQVAILPCPHCTTLFCTSGLSIDLDSHTPCLSPGICRLLHSQAHCQAVLCRHLHSHAL